MAIALRLVAGAAATPAETGFSVRPAQTAPLTYLIRNLDTISLTQDTPLTDYGLPQTEDQETILLKIMGNATTINISWTIVDESTSPFVETITVNAAFGIPASSSASPIVAQDIVRILMNEFVPRDINAKYHFFLDASNIDNTGAPAFNPPKPPFQNTTDFTNTENKKYANSSSFKRMGVIRNLNLTAMGTSPVTFKATVDFIAGNVIASVETE